MRLRVAGFGSQVSLSGFQANKFRASGFGALVSDSGFQVPRIDFRVSGLRFRVSGLGFEICRFWVTVPGSTGSEVQGYLVRTSTPGRTLQ